MEFNINPNCQELIKKGKCKADCCGCIPINAGYWQRLKKYAQNKNYKIFKFRYKGENFVKAVTEDCKCVFIKNDFSCAIYHTNLRPEVCRMFGNNRNEALLACPHINEGKEQIITQKGNDILRKLAYNGDRCAKELINR